MLSALPATAQEKDDVYHRLSPGDEVRIMLFQDKSLQVDARISDKGIINYPLAGNFEVSGMTTKEAEAKLAQLLKQSGIKIEARQVSLVLTKQREVLNPVAPLAARTGGGKDADYRLGAGDAIRIAVFQSPDLLLETRVSESGTISYPLIGTVEIGGISVAVAEHKIAKLLNDGRFVIDPQVTIVVLTVRSNQVSVLGQVNRPGKYPLELTNMKVSDALALAGGVIPIGADSAVLTGTREGKYFHQVIDIRSMILEHKLENDIAIQNGDILYVDRADMFYVYGEVQRPGSYRLERGMTVMQALAQGGGVTLRGTERGIRIYRQTTDGKKETVEPDMQDVVKADDVIYVRESYF